MIGAGPVLTFEKHRLPQPRLTQEENLEALFCAVKHTLALLAFW